LANLDDGLGLVSGNRGAQLVELYRGMCFLDELELKLDVPELGVKRRQAFRLERHQGHLEKVRYVAASELVEKTVNIKTPFTKWFALASMSAEIFTVDDN
jgi:hypothetical protein